MSKDNSQIINIVEDINSPDRISRINLLRNKLPDSVREQAFAIDDEWMSCPAEDLNPSPIDKLLRISFWKEFERSEEAKSFFNITKALNGICYDSTFYNSLIKNPKRLAYIIRPFVEYDVTLSELEKDGFARVREALSVSPVLENGRLDAKAAMAHLKALEFVNIRLRGMPIKNVRNLNLNVDAKSPDKEMSPEELEFKLEELRSAMQERKMKNVGPAPEDN